MKPLAIVISNEQDSEQSFQVSIIWNISLVIL